MNRRGAFIAIVCVCTLSACGSNKPSTSAASAATPFCHTLGNAVALLEPETGATTLAERRSHYNQLSTELGKAQNSAPRALSNDIASFARAIATYKVALADVNYDLDALYATPGGTKLAADTSHALSPAVVHYLTGPCGLSPNGGEKRSP